VVITGNDGRKQAFRGKGSNAFAARPARVDKVRMPPQPFVGTDSPTTSLAVRWYLSFRLSYAEVAEWLAERR
jgi:hypothetical protein